MLRLLLVALTVISAGVPSAAMAQAVSGSVAVNGRNVPLPPGTWQTVAEANTQVHTSNTAMPVNGTVRNVALLRTEGGRVTGLVVISTNREPSHAFAGWSLEPECTRSDIHAVRVEVNVARQQDCWTVNHVTMTRGSNPTAFVNQYYEAAARVGGMPPTTLRVTSRMADNLHYITVRYHFAPDTARFPPATEAWGTNPWHRDRLDEARRGFVNAVIAWGAGAHAGVSRGFRGTGVQGLPEPAGSAHRAR